MSALSSLFSWLADRFTVKNLFASAFGRKFNKDGWLILKARHF